MATKNELDPLRVKKNIKIALCRTVSEIIAFFCTYTEIQDGHKKWRKHDFFFQNVTSRPCKYPVSQKSLYQINAFWRLMQKFKMSTKNGGKMTVAEGCHYTLQIPILSISLYLAPLRFYIIHRNSRWLPIMGLKRFCEKFGTWWTKKFLASFPRYMR